jgi:hypothetical protein
MSQRQRSRSSTTQDLELPISPHTHLTMAETEEIEVNFRLDADGRTSCPDNGEDDTPGEGSAQIDYSTKAVPTQFSIPSNFTKTPAFSVKDDGLTTSTMLDELLFDCEIADSGLMPRTFWIPASGFKPRFSLEQMALDVFKHHVKDVPYDASTSGAEWWVQLRPSPEKTGRYSMHGSDDNQEQDEKDLSKTGISFHWDKDEDLRILCGGTTYVHPHVSTVTYLTSIGAPTLAINFRVNNFTGQYMIPGQAEGDTATPDAFVSWPAVGKHMSFDGRFLHSAPPDLMEKGSFDKQRHFEEPPSDQPGLRKLLIRRHRRVTFLVNIWLNYHPFDVKPFPDTMIDKMSGTEDSAISLSFPVPQDAKVASVRTVTIKDGQAKERASTTESNTTPFTWAMGDCDSKESLNASIPLQAVQEEAKQGGNVRMQWQPSSAEGVNSGIVISQNSAEGVDSGIVVGQKGEETSETAESGNKRPRLDE